MTNNVLESIQLSFQFTSQGGVLAYLILISSVVAYYLIFLDFLLLKYSMKAAIKSPSPALQIAAAIAYCQPLAGLLGTVQGMIDGFALIAHHDSGYSSFAGQISSALVTTGLGLVFSLPALFAIRGLNSMRSKRTLFNRSNSSAPQ